MALQCQWYTLFGFSKELDWRPLHFVDSVPAQRICNACGLLPRMTVFLPCRHVLCQTCYDQCLLDDGHACPLDGAQFLEEDAEWRDFPSEKLLRRKVKCWNEDNGCKAITTVSDMHKHFYDDCVHHSTRCPECSMSVLCSNACAHRRSKCSSYAKHVLPENMMPSKDSAQQGLFAALEAILQEGVEELGSKLDQVIRGSTAHCERQNEVSHILNALRETVMQSSEEQTRATNESIITFVRQVKEDLAAQTDRLIEVSQSTTKEVKVAVADATGQSLVRLEENHAELRRHFTTDADIRKNVTETVSAFEGTLLKALERTAETICQKCTTNVDRIAASKAIDTESDQSTTNPRKDLLGLNTLDIKSCQFLVNGLKSLKQAATSEGHTEYFANTTYLCGYYISPGVRLNKTESSMSVHALMKLNKGVIDEFLQWPFQKLVNLAFICSSKGGSRELSNKTTSNLKFYARPTESSNLSCYWTSGCDIDDLEREGYAEGDQLWVKFELLPLDTK